MMEMNIGARRGNNTSSHRKIEMCYIKKVIVFLIVTCGFLAGSLKAQGFITVKGQKIVDSKGIEVYFKGMGLGGWLEPEGYMFGMSSFANSPSQIRNKIEKLVGKTNADTLYSYFQRNFVTEDDIKALHSWGFNLVRLPFHYSILTPPDSPGVYSEIGFSFLDSVVAWCKRWGMYVILDMHCAPGGQSDQTISDYDPSVPSLWQDTLKESRTVEIWKRIASRYYKETAIAGYDLLNEPRWDFPGGDNKPLRDLYVRITRAIRSIDTNHIIYIEGNQYATDFTGLTPPWDPKMVYSFHKYWNQNDQSSIQNYLKLRSAYNIPLWLGESGENSNQWYVDCIKLMQQNDIGWSWWTLKKFNTINSPLNVVETPEYRQLLDYWNGRSSPPSTDAAYNALLEMALKSHFRDCVFQKDVIDAMMRQPYTYATLPFAENVIPGIIYADNYDMGNDRYAYLDSVYQNIGGSPWNNGWSYRNDGVDLEPCLDHPSNGYDVGWISGGEWLKYTVSVVKADTYSVDIRYSSANGGGKLVIQMDSNIVGNVISLPKSGGLQSWATITVNGFYLTEGAHALRLFFITGGFNLNYLMFSSGVNGISQVNGRDFKYEVDNIFPNPSSSSSVIKYTLSSTSHVEIEFFDILGQVVAKVFSGEENPGEHTVIANMGGFPSGIYFCRILINGRINTRKLFLIK